MVNGGEVDPNLMADDKGSDEKFIPSATGGIVETRYVPICSCGLSIPLQIIPSHALKSENLMGGHFISATFEIQGVQDVEALYEALRGVTQEPRKK